MSRISVMYNDVKKQHYVWEFYLKAWCFEGNKVWCRKCARCGDIYFTYVKPNELKKKEEINKLENDIKVLQKKLMNLKNDN